MRRLLIAFIPVALLCSRSGAAQVPGEVDPAQAPASGLAQSAPAASNVEYNPYTQPQEPAPAQQQPAQPEHNYGADSQAQAAAAAASPTRQPTYYILAPPALPYLEGVPAPTGYHLREHANVGLRTGGLVTLLASYAVGLGYAFAHSFDDGTGWLAAPVIGPWGALGARHFECNAGENLGMDPVKDQVEEANECLDAAFEEVFAVTFIGLDGLLQATGLTLFAVGAASRQREWIRNDLKVGFGPRLLGRGTWGMGATGTF